MNNDIKVGLCSGLRLPAREKLYWLGQMQTFANMFASMQISRVDFGKQDIRGAHNITLVDMNQCVPRQEHFASMKEMLAFIHGYNMASGAAFYDRFADYKKGAK